MVMRKLWLVLLAAAVLVGNPPVAVAKQCSSIRCLCKQARDAALKCCLEPCCDDSGTCYADLVDDHGSCLDAVKLGRSACIEKNCPPIPGDPGGHCVPTVGCVEACDAAESPSTCDAAFRRAVKR